MASRVLVLTSAHATEPLERFVGATVEALSLTHEGLDLQDMGIQAPNQYFRSHAWRRVVEPWTVVEHFSDSSVPATWIEVRGKDVGDVQQIESLLRPVLPVESAATLLATLLRDGVHPSRLVRTALAHVGLGMPGALREAIETALASGGLDLFAAACTAASLLPDSSFVPIVQARGLRDPALSRLVESTLAQLENAPPRG